MEDKNELEPVDQEKKPEIIPEKTADLKKLKVKIVGAFIVICLFVGLIAYGLTSFKNQVYQEGVVEGEKISEKNVTKVAKLDFENIGELCTQEANLTMVKKIDKSRNLFSIDIPGTNSMAIFSYDVTIKAGLDFSKITYEVKDKQIHIKCPKVRILSNEIDTDSYQIYYENENLLTNISTSDYNGSLTELRKKAQKAAKEKGIYDRAKENAEAILKEFFSQEYDLNTYTIEFEWA